MPYPNRKGKNNPNWRGGKPRCLLCKNLLPRYTSQYCPKCFFKTISGKNNYQWQEKPSYKTIHRWLERKFVKPDKCDFCGNSPTPGKDGRTRLHWASKNHCYRRERKFWLCLCVPCHTKYDKPYLKRSRNSKGYFQ